MCKSPVTPVRDQGMFRPPIRSLDWIHVFVLRISLVSHAQENESLEVIHFPDAPRGRQILSRH